MSFNNVARISMRAETSDEAINMRKLSHINLTISQALELAMGLSEDIVTPSFKSNLENELRRVQELNLQRVRLIEHRIKERIKTAKILAVDFSR